MAASELPTRFAARRPRVLYFAYSCAPGWGSEPGAGWNRSVAMSKYCDVWVICEEETCRSWIEDYYKTHPANPHLHFIYVPYSRFERRLKSIPLCFYAAYNLWQRRAYRVAQRLDAEIHFDLTHQVTFCGFREPSYLWKLDVPFVWGPIGGTQNYPWRFIPGAGLLSGCQEIVRSAVNLAQLFLSLRVRKAAQTAGAVFAANSTGEEDIKRATGVEAIRLAEIGIENLNEKMKPRVGSLVRCESFGREF